MRLGPGAGVVRARVAHVDVEAVAVPHIEPALRDALAPSSDCGRTRMSAGSLRAALDSADAPDDAL